MFPGIKTASGSIVGKPRSSPASKAVVAEGWPALLKAMDAAKINTHRRIAAFLTTLVFESWGEYNVHQVGTTSTYTGRGYIQLTGPINYTDAGDYLSIDLIGDPDLALDLRYSAAIATWYWTVARPMCNTYADKLQMGKVNRMIGYPLAGENDANRCRVFALALQKLTGSATPEPVDCTR